MNKSFCCSGCELRLWERSSVSPTHFLITDANYLHHHLHTIMRQTLQRAEAVGFFFLSFIREWGDCHTGYAFANRQDGWSRLCPSPSSLGGWQLLALRSQHKRSLIYVYVCLSVNLSIYWSSIYESTHLFIHLFICPFMSLSIIYLSIYLSPWPICKAF